MKIIHVSDVHFDIPFKRLSDRESLGKERRLEQREAFRSLIDFSKENNVDVILIAGDLFEQEYIRESTIEYLNNLFKEIPEKKIFITPGNHDPKLKNSYYTIYDWNENVHIFSEKLEVVHLNEADIYGYGFNNFEMNNFNEQNIKIQNPEKNNIFISHGDIYKTSENYNPMDINELKNKFDYIALGHIHKRDEYYSGSLISLGFDEPGEHGFYYIELENKKIIKKEFIKADKRELIKKEINISDINSEEELIEKINSINTENNLYEIYLIGKRNFKIEINLNLLQKNIIKIKNNTELEIKNKLSENENTLHGIFVKNLKQKLNNKEINENQFERILELENEIIQK